MQTQLALEDASRPKRERAVLKAEETALLKAHEEEWLGELAPFVSDEDTLVRPTWRYGVLSGLVVQMLSVALARALVRAPTARFVRELHLHGTTGELGQRSELCELIDSPFLSNLRVFRMGGDVPPEDGWCDCHTYVGELEQVVAGMSRVEVLDLYCKGYKSAPLFALTNLTHLRELRVYHLGGYRWHEGYAYALDVLANNPAFANLTHLLFHPHQPEGLGEDGRYHSYLPLEQVRHLFRSPHLKKLTHLQLRLSDMGDDGIREIIAPGILKRLKWLDLRHGAVTDEGAKLLAACPDAKKLERIDLSRNAVSRTGLAALRKAGVNAVANNPMTQSELESREYLREGDFE